MEGEPICDAEQFEMLRQAREKADKLLVELIKTQQEAEAKGRPDDVAPEQWEQGRQAMANAIASTKRMLKSLDDATRIAAVDNN